MHFFEFTGKSRVHYFDIFSDFSNPVSVDCTNMKKLKSLSSQSVKARAQTVGRDH